MKQRYSLVVVGAGSGGIGAALAAARRGVSTLLLEQNRMLGGTSTLGGVNAWEMGVGGLGIPFDLYRRMQQIPQAVGIYSVGRHFCMQTPFCWPHTLDQVNYPGGEQVVDPQRCYADTLRRHPKPEYREGAKKWVWAKENWHGVLFEPEALHAAARSLLEETGCCRICYGLTVRSVKTEHGRVVGIELDDGSRLTADYWIDGTGDGTLCRLAGCGQLCGVDPRARFQEPGAPQLEVRRVNPPTLLFRVRPADTDAVEPLPAGIPEKLWWRGTPTASCINHYPCGDLNINMLPTMDGEEFLSLTRSEAYDECRRRVFWHWHFLQAHFPEFRRFRLHTIFPMLGVRESFRTVCERMLTEHDLLKTLRLQNEPDIISLADHAMDRHGDQGGCPEVEFPYGIPFRCLIPKGMTNMLIACRGGGFSSLAASSVRLSRTMLQLGQAAGNAVALAQETQITLPEVFPQRLRERLRDEQIQLEYPYQLRADV